MMLYVSLTQIKNAKAKKKNEKPKIIFNMYFIKDDDENQGFYFLYDGWHDT